MSLLSSRRSGEAPVDIEAFHQMRVGVERVRVPELLFQVCPYNTIQYNTMHLDVRTYVRYSFLPWPICGLHKIYGLYVSFPGIITPAADIALQLHGCSIRACVLRVLRTTAEY
jgi:hypothetical protein